MQPLDKIRITKDYVFYYIRVSVKHNMCVIHTVYDYSFTIFTN